MAQTENEKSTETRRTRPGQRQQERLEREKRRRKRTRTWLLSAAAAFILIAAAVGLIQYNRQQAAIEDAKNKQATATAALGETAIAVTATANIQATGTTLAQAVQTVSGGTPIPTAGPEKPPTVSGTPVQAANGLSYIDVKAGNGAEVKKGDNIQVLYTGWFEENGQKFDSNFDRGGIPYLIQDIGNAKLIQGWNEGLIGMKEGGTRRLFIPAALGYGAQGYPPQIPPNANLIFDVTVVKIEPAPGG